MSSYFQSTVTFGVKLSEETQNKIQGIKFPDYISIQNTGDGEVTSISTILGITFSEGFIEENKHCLELPSLRKMEKEIEEKEETLRNDLNAIFSKFDIEQDLDFKIYLTSYIY